jgi:histidinol-phosphate aminotransferase
VTLLYQETDAPDHQLAESLTHPRPFRGVRFNPDLLRVPLYIAGRSIEEVKEEFGLEDAIKLASNESPIGPSPLALQAAQATLARAHRYPGVTGRDLRRKLADRLGVTADHILVGNGGTDVLRIVTQAFVFDGGNTIMSGATFPMYQILTTTFGGASRLVPPLTDYRHDLDAMLAAIDDDTRLVYLCSPNNPSGDVISQADADAFMAGVPNHVVVIFDESYCDYVDDPGYADSLAYTRAGRNTLTVRSFSKSAGLANLRVGYLVGPLELVHYLRHARLPFHVGDVALAAAAASLDDCDYHGRSREIVLAGRAYLHACVTDLGLRCLPSQANFLTLVDPPLPAAHLVECLLRQGIIVRLMTGFGMPNAIRVTVGAPAANEKFIQVLTELLANEKVKR